MTSTLVLLSYNERDNLKSLIERIPLSQFDEVFAVDGGSNDGTLDVYRHYEIRTLIQENRGRGNAFQLARQSLNTDCVVFYSTDGNENPEDLCRILALLREGYEMVVAGRYLLPGSETDDSDDPIRIRKMAGIFGGMLVRIIWGSGVKDPINGLRGFSTSGLSRLSLDAQWHDIELQSTIRAAKIGLRVIEFPTRELKRIGGQRKASAGTVKILWSLGKTIIREIAIGKNF